MEATEQTQQLLFDLQYIDMKIRKISTQAHNLEETKHLEAIVAQRRQLAVEQHHLAEKIGAEHEITTNLENDINQFETQISTIDNKLAAHGVTPKQVIALTNQQKTLEDKKSESENELLHHLETTDRLQQQGAILKSNDERLHGAGSDIQNRRNDKLAHLKSKMEKQRAKRRICLESIPSEIVNLYAKMSKNASNTVVVRFLHGHLEGGDSQLSPVDLNAVSSTQDPNKLLVFEDENIIVVRFNDEVKKLSSPIE